MRKIKTYGFWLNIEVLGRLIIALTILLCLARALICVKLNFFQQIGFMLWGIIILLWVNVPIWS